MPERFRLQLIDRIETVTIVILMPFFLVLTGLITNVEFESREFLSIFALVTVVTVIGKVIGTAVPAKFFGESWPTALALGALMQTKGLMEVVVLTILLDAGLITKTVFSALVLMAVACTLLAVPLTRLALYTEKLASDSQN
jgi:Kef-type K+ transport system membrane component KefB